MKLKILIGLLAISFLPAFGSDKPKPFQTIDLGAFRPDAHGCDKKWTDFVNSMVWIDEDHVAIWLVWSCNSSIAKYPSEMTLVVSDTTGHTRSVVREFYGLLPGPSGTLLISPGNQADLLDHELRTVQTLKCPGGDTACGSFGSPSGATGSDFALCSYAATEETCDFYIGFPARKVSEQKLAIAASGEIPGDPYKRESVQVAGPDAPHNQTAWRVSSSELWYFDSHSRLASQNSNGKISQVSSEEWTTDNNDCAGSLSVSTPHRFLATCVGTHLYTDGDLDALFGYSRIALFDVGSHRILAQIDGPSYINARLSPSGKFIAVAHDEKVRLYRVD